MDYNTYSRHMSYLLIQLDECKSKIRYFRHYDANPPLTEIKRINEIDGWKKKMDLITSDILDLRNTHPQFA